MEYTENMNIFVLDNDPVKAAHMYCDKHVPKMVVELYQQLGSALRRHGVTDEHMPLTKAGTPLKGGYHNHPCTKWCGDSEMNFWWARRHALELCAEYYFRYNKIHFCHQGIHDMGNIDVKLPNIPQTPFALAMPDEYKSSNAIDSYRRYYIMDKSRFAKWEKGRKAPHWWTKEECYV
jgi:hypothetical protein